MPATTATTTWPWLAWWVGPVCGTVDGVSVITKCARLSILSSIMLAHQASSRPGGGASAGVRALHQPARCFIFDGDRRYVPLVCGHGRGQCTFVHSLHRPTSSHIWHWASAPAPDLTAVGPTQQQVRTWGSGTEVHGPSHPLAPTRPPRLAASPPCFLLLAHGHLGSIFVSFLAPSNHGRAGIMRLQRYKRPRYLWPSYLGAPPAHTADAFPPSLASHLRQGMAGHGRALTDRLTPLQHAFWPSFCRNGQSWNGLPRRAHHGHNYKCPPSHLSHLASFLCSIIRPNIIETIQLSLPHSSQTSVQDTNTTSQPTPTNPTSNQQPATTHNRLSTVLSLPPTTVPTASSTTRLT